LIASTPATTAEPASFATSCATRVTRAIGAGTRDVLWRFALVLAAAARVPDDDFPLAALRPDDVFVLALRLDVVVERPRLADVDERADEALTAAADLPRDFVLFVPFLLALREALLPDFPRDFLALVAIDASPRSRRRKNHIDDSKNQAHP